jgi:DNA-binding transcriptional MerR regulator
METLFSIKEASQMTQLSASTLRRLERKGLIKFKRINGRRYISYKQLLKAPILSLGKAASLISCSYYQLRKWAREGKIAVTKSPICRISYQQLQQLKKNKGKLPSLLK